MAYITKDDLKNFLYSEDIEQLDRSDELSNFIEAGIGFAESYLKDRIGNIFDLDTEFQKSGDERSNTLIEVISHIAIWKLCLSSPLVDTEGKKHFNYEWALEQIKLIEQGKLLTNLPRKTDSDGDAKKLGVQYGFSEAIENENY